MNKIFFSATLAFTLAFSAVAQQNNSGQQQAQGQKELHKEITLEKDFVPVEKKATKKNTLPKVKKVASPEKTQVSYSDWVAPTDVPASIPTMMPYGYRTAHNFSNKRGYLDIGGGTAANFNGSAGYRIIDTEDMALSAWVQHNSTWSSKNSSKLIDNDAYRFKQQFNDNLLGIDFSNRMKQGTLSIGAKGHFDSFNYYGSFDPDDEKNYKKQAFYEAGIYGGWEGVATLSDHEVNYGIDATFNHAGYDKGRPFDLFYNPLNLGGAKENVLNITLNADFAFNDNSSVGMELMGDYVNFSHNHESTNYGMVTITPYYKWSSSNFTAQVGADILLGKPHLMDFDKNYGGLDNNKFHISPRARFDFNFIDGAAFFINVEGGKSLNTLSEMANINRYSDPTGAYYNSFSPFDGDAGFVIGPFSGFSAKVWAGYAITKSDINVYIPTVATSTRYATTFYHNLKCRGMRMGAELKYKYRSLIEASANINYYPCGDDLDIHHWNSTCSPFLDGTGLAGNFDIKVTPISKLSINLGLNYRGQRGVDAFTNEDDDGWDWTDNSDVINLHAGASYRFEKTVTLWVKANNLLNRKWDELPGLGAQKIGVMGGIGLVF